jgi:hypothetical protein
MMFVFYFFNTFSHKNTDPKVLSMNFLDFKLAYGGNLGRSFFFNLNSFSMREEKIVLKQ